MFPVTGTMGIPPSLDHAGQTYPFSVVASAAFAEYPVDHSCIGHPPTLATNSVDMTLAVQDAKPVSGRVFLDLARPQNQGKREPSGFYRGELPLRQVKISLQRVGGSAVDAYTDDNGRYSFNVAELGKPYQLKITLQDKDGLVQVMDGERSANEVAWAQTQPFTVTDTMTQDIEMEIGAKNDVTYIPSLDGANPTNSSQDHFAHLAYTYHNFQFSARLIGQLSVAAKSTEQVFVYVAQSEGGKDLMSHSGGTNCSRHEVKIPVKRSQANSVGRPYGDFHEYGHHIMCASTIAGEQKEPDLAAGDKNHGGIVNSTSADAWVEGFATYMAAVIAELGKDSVPEEIDYSGKSFNLASGGATLDDPRSGNPPDKPNAKFGDKAEEFAIATVLWDLHKRLGRMDLWSLLKNNRPDLLTWKAVYDAVKALEPSKPVLARLRCNFRQGTPQEFTVSGVDCLFIERGFYHDADGNGLYDPGEKVGVTRWDGNPPRDATVERPDPPAIFGSTLLLTARDGETGAILDDVQFLIQIEYAPPWQTYNLSYTVASDGALPYAMPITIPGNPSHAVIVAQRQGHPDSPPLTLTSEFYHERIYPFREGGVREILLEHTFVLGPPMIFLPFVHLAGND
jgi:hypothetical protein